MNRKPDEKAPEGERIAKVMARAGLCSRRDAETWIVAGRVSVNGKLISSPALNVGPHDRIVVDGKPMPVRERTRLFRYYKPRGLMTTNRDPEGRPTLFQQLPKDLPRVVTVGRLDFNSEGLLLLTNDGGLARVLELPSTGWLRRYRVRAKGRARPDQLERIRKGVTVEGVSYGAMEVSLDREQGSNVWLTVALREGKNREVRKVLSSIGLEVNRLIRVSYGPFQLAEMADGEVEEVKTAILREQISGKLAQESGADFDAPLREVLPPEKPKPERKDFPQAPGKSREGREARHGKKEPRKDVGKRDGNKRHSEKRYNEKRPRPRQKFERREKGGGGRPQRGRR